MESNDYESPDGTLRIQSFRSKSFGVIGETRPSILSGPNEPFAMFESMSKRMDEHFNSAFNDVSGRFSNMENQLEKAFSQPRMKPKLILPENYDTEIQPRFEENVGRANLDQNVVYLLITIAGLLLILSLILTAMIHLNRKRSRKRQEVIVPIDFDAPPAYSMSTQAVLKITDESEPLKTGAPVVAPPPHEK